MKGNNCLCHTHKIIYMYNEHACDMLTLSDIMQYKYYAWSASTCTCINVHCTCTAPSVY